MNAEELILIECYEDYVGLWSVLREIEDDWADIGEAEARFKTLELLRKLLIEELIYAGDYDDNETFEGWKLSPKDVIERIELEWEALGRKPNIAEIVLFTTTKKGDIAAERLIQASS